MKLPRACSLRNPPAGFLGRATGGGPWVEIPLPQDPLGPCAREHRRRWLKTQVLPDELMFDSHSFLLRYQWQIHSYSSPDSSVEVSNKKPIA